jgi:hypothetical protein
MEFSKIVQPVGHRFVAKEISRGLFVVPNAYEGSVRFFDERSANRSQTSDMKWECSRPISPNDTSSNI